MVDYPEYLDLTPYMSQTEDDALSPASESSFSTGGEQHSLDLCCSHQLASDTRFELCSLVVHSGSTVHSGHYYAYVKQFGADSGQPDK